MSNLAHDPSPLSPMWKQAVLLVMILGFSLLTLVTVRTYAGAVPLFLATGRLVLGGDEG